MRAPPFHERSTAPCWSPHSLMEQVCGEGLGVEGDGVVPLCSAHLEGAVQLTLDGVMHSMSRIGTFDDAAPDHLHWYGSGRVVDAWLGAIVATQDDSSDATLAAAVAVEDR